MITLIVITYILTSEFKKDETKTEYILEANKLTNLRVSSSVILNDLLNKNEVTFDPTNGVSIKKVLENLKSTDKKKILLLGSSQLVTLNDDWSNNNYLRRVDKLLQKNYGDDTIVYNLSMGGMSIAEKKIILKKAIEIFNFNDIVICIGPYDSFKNEIREKVLELKDYKIENKGLKKRENHIKIVYGIQATNEYLEDSFKDIINQNSFFINNKAAIKLWLNDKYKLSKLKEPKTPLAWETKNQELNNQTGWSSDFYKSKNHSLKIVNTNNDKDAQWRSKKVSLIKPTNKIKISGWSKSLNVKNPKLYCLDFKIDFQDGTHKWVVKKLKFKEGTNDWNYVENTFKFDKNIIAFTPHALFYKSSGTVWFDDIFAEPIYEHNNSVNLIINSNIEEARLAREVHTLSFSKETWDDIYKNSNDMLDFMNEFIPKTTKQYLLVPPVFTSKDINGYSQDYELKMFFSKLTKKVKEYNIKLINASNLLDETHYVEIRSGKKKGLIEPLHFDSRGHKILADLLMRNIDIK